MTVPRVGTAAAPAGVRPPCGPEAPLVPCPRSCALGCGVSRAGQWYLWLSGPGGEQLPSPSGVLRLVLGWDLQSRACALGCWELVASRLCCEKRAGAVLAEHHLGHLIFIQYPSEAQRGAMHLSFPRGQRRTGWNPPLPCSCIKSDRLARNPLGWCWWGSSEGTGCALHTRGARDAPRSARQGHVWTRDH